MSKKPMNFQWLGFTEDQVRDLNFLEHLGNNGWSRNSQTEAVMPNLIVRLDASIGHQRVKDAMQSIGYDRDDLHMLDRWLSKARTGRFGK